MKSWKQHADDAGICPASPLNKNLKLEHYAASTQWIIWPLIGNVQLFEEKWIIKWTQAKLFILILHTPLPTNWWTTNWSTKQLNLEVIIKKMHEFKTHLSFAQEHQWRGKKYPDRYSWSFRPLELVLYYNF
jgi:hypothetical protein